MPSPNLKLLDPSTPIPRKRDNLQYLRDLLPTLPPRQPAEISIPKGSDPERVRNRLIVIAKRKGIPLRTWIEGGKLRVYREK